MLTDHLKKDRIKLDEMKLSWEMQNYLFEKVARHCFAQGVRAFDTSSRLCVYKDEEGRRCAVGALMSKKCMEKYGGWTGAVGNLPEEALQMIMKRKKYSRFDVEFLQNLQRVHDHLAHWETTKEMRRTLMMVGKAYKLRTDFLKELKFEKDRVNDPSCGVLFYA